MQSWTRVRFPPPPFSLQIAGNRSESLLVRVLFVAVAEGVLEIDSSDYRKTVPRFDPEARKANLAFVGLRDIAQRKQATPAQIALAWLLAHRQWIVPIPGTTKPERLRENIGAASIELAPDDVAEIEDAAADITPQGARYSAAAQRMIDR